MQFRIVSVSDDSAANKTSNFATEGTLICLAEDRLTDMACDKDDYLSAGQVSLLSGYHHILHGASQKAKQVSHSTSHAETDSAAKCVPMGQLTLLRFAEPLLQIQLQRTITPEVLLQLMEADRPALPLQHDHWIDCMDLWELCTGRAAEVFHKINLSALAF